MYEKLKKMHKRKKRSFLIDLMFIYVAICSFTIPKPSPEVKIYIFGIPIFFFSKCQSA